MLKIASAFLLFLFASDLACGQDQDLTIANSSYSYQETIDIYRELAKQHDIGSLKEYGLTDVGKPLHLFVISFDKEFDPQVIKRNDKRVVLINNAIHPGEPCGVDASIQLAKELLLDPEKAASYLQNTVVCIIPFYNIGGGLNRSCCSRVNQNGPEEYGFRGNAQNLDLNRDFIKTGSRNAQEFARIFTEWDPDVFVDTHTTNGWDYQYSLGLITSQRDKMQQDLSEYTYGKMVPALFAEMEKRGKRITQYVYAYGKTPEDGIKDYLDSPRYSTGYATLHHTIGFITEAHKFKPFAERVDYTYNFLDAVVKWVNNDAARLGEFRAKAKEASKRQQQFPLTWEADTVRHELIEFRGYEANYKKSELSGLDRLWYDRDAPWTKEIPYYNHFNATTVVEKPKMYVFSQAHKRVAELLTLNGITVHQFTEDTLLEVMVYYINDYETSPKPYEGHYLHSNVSVRSEQQTIQYYKGDYMVNTNQELNRFIVETLEPQGMDSYFCWNFFDGILQQKEWFSDYAFEETAIELLAQNPELKALYEAKKEQEPDFAASHWQQLYFLYKNSPYFENTTMRHPIVRVE